MMPTSASSASRSGQIARAFVALYALLQTHRLIAFVLAQDVLTNRAAAAWLFPAFVDIFVGVTAPIVAYALWRRRGLAVWVTAIVWFAISISDHLDALTTGFTSTLPSLFPKELAAVVGFQLFAVVVDALAIACLAREGTRSLYLGMQDR